MKMGVERGVLQVRHVGRGVCWSGAGASVFLPYTLYSATLLVHNDQMADVICCRPWVRTTPPMRASSCVGQTARHSRLDWTHSSTQPLRYATAVLQNFQGRQREWGIRAGLDPWSMSVLQEPYYRFRLGVTGLGQRVRLDPLISTTIEARWRVTTRTWLERLTGVCQVGPVGTLMAPACWLVSGLHLCSSLTVLFCTALHCTIMSCTCYPYQLA